MKDCPFSWGSEGFLGKLIIPDSLWREKFNAERAEFRWDDWRISRSRLDAQSLVGTQSVNRYMSDYARELKARYGSVVRGGSVGAPVEQGYPLGLKLRSDVLAYRKLVRAKLPFTMIYLGATGKIETVRFAMVSNPNKSGLLGTGKRHNSRDSS